MAGGLRDTRTFFTKGTPAEWEYVLSNYKDALKLKARQKKRPEELLKLDCWYQEELPQLISSRKEKHVTHNELVQTMKWKLSRGKYRPKLTDLVRINTPAAVMLVSKKAFRKLPNLASAIQTLSSLKGIGPATASAILAAGAPELAPYMADECLMAIPECQSIDYTVQEYLIFTEQILLTVERLNATDKNKSWTPHKVEKALWTYCIVNEHEPSVFANMPSPQEDQDESDSLSSSQNGKSNAAEGDAVNSEDQNVDDVVEDDSCKQRDNNGQSKESEDEDEVESSRAVDTQVQSEGSEDSGEHGSAAASDHDPEDEEQQSKVKGENQTKRGAQDADKADISITTTTKDVMEPTSKKLKTSAVD